MPVVGMMCAGCSAAVEQSLAQMPGVAEATVSLASRMARVTYDAAMTSPAEMKAVVDAMGYRLVIDNGEDVQAIRFWPIRLSTLRSRASMVSLLNLLPARSSSPA